MDIFELFSYKLENFLNIRLQPKELGSIFYEQEEASLFSVAARKSNGSTFSVSRWQDLFSVSAFKRSMSKIRFSEPDCYAILLVLSRLGYLLEIDNRQRSNKDYFVFFYVIQLVCLKNSALDADARIRNYMLRFLLFELSIDDEAYRRFGIQDHQVMMATDALGPLAFLDVIDLAYEALEADGRKEHALLATLKTYQAGVIRLLAEPDGQRYRLAINDRYGEFMYPDVFLDTYARDRKRIHDALIDTVNPFQSTENLFVSNIILMNYSFHVLKDKPREISRLKTYVNDELLFGKILEALIHRQMAVSRETFETVGIGLDLPPVEDDHKSFYNILYSL